MVVGRRCGKQPGYPLDPAVCADAASARPVRGARATAPLKTWTAVVPGVVGTTFPPLTPPAFRLARTFTAVASVARSTCPSSWLPHRVRSSVPGAAHSTLPCCGGKQPATFGSSRQREKPRISSIGLGTWAGRRAECPSLRAQRAADAPGLDSSDQAPVASSRHRECGEGHWRPATRPQPATQPGTVGAAQDTMRAPRPAPTRASP